MNTITTIKHRSIALGLTPEQWMEAIQKVPTSMIASNTKLRKSNIYQFSLPAFHASIVKNGKLTLAKTCPSAGICSRFCYASQGTFEFSVVLIAHTRNLQFYLNDREAFKSRMVSDILRIKKLKAFRVHDSGDFFSRQYALDWFEIMHMLPNVQFYAYTKMVPLFIKLQHEGLIPKNFSVIYSYGGTHDYLINEATDRHSKVFASHEEMLKADYADTYETDDNAADPTKRCIGLVYHGKPKYTGTTP